MTENPDFMTFEEAAEFLNTPRSTLYRWLREGKVPGQKLGRQWRFLRDELDAFRRGEFGTGASEALKPLANFLRQRQPTEDEMKQTNWNAPNEVAEAMIWDAVDAGAGTLHLQPKGTGHELRYRTPDGLEHVLDLQPDAFDALDAQWNEASRELRDPDQRRMFLERGDESPDRVQVRYQRLETLRGPRVTLRLLLEQKTHLSIDDITEEPDDAATLRRWCGRPYGIVLIAGRSGSGKTTTAYCCLNETARDNDRVVFTLEDQIGFMIENVNQVELDLDDPDAYRRAFHAIFEQDLDVLFIGSTLAARHRDVLWDTARSAAESGHLVFLQMEADSAHDAIERFQGAVELPAEDLLVGASWQELVREDGRIRGRYEFVPGVLDRDS